MYTIAKPPIKLIWIRNCCFISTVKVNLGNFSSILLMIGKLISVTGDSPKLMIARFARTVINENYQKITLECAIFAFMKAKA